MNEKKAKKLRKIIYPGNLSNRQRTYYRSKETGQIIADEKRRGYQKLKEETKNG